MMRKAQPRLRKVRRSQPLWKIGKRKKSGSKLLRWVRRIPLKPLGVLLAVFLGYELLTLPFFSVATLPTDNPSETALMRQRIDEAHEKGRILRIDYRWVPLTMIPKHVRMAVLVAEDSAFFSHDGVDWHEVWESMETNLEKGRIVRGGSTITQQLAKNLYLSTSRDPVRKLKELLITWMLESRLSKQRILELYLNIIEWGPGVFGIEAAAQRYFHKPASSLTREEAARLAAVIPSPLRRRPTDDNEYLIKKAELILRRMSSR